MARQRMGSSKTGWATTVWIDPGGETGWGVMSIDPIDLVNTSVPIEKAIAHWQCGEMVGNENQMASEALELYDMWDDAAIGIESFQLRQRAVELSPVSIRGKIEYGLWLAEKWEAADNDREMGRPRHLFTQTPSFAKGTLTDDRQREYGLWVPGHDHKRDGIKHCFTFLKQARKKPRMRAYAWPSLFKINGEPIKNLPPTSKRSKY